MNESTGTPGVKAVLRVALAQLGSELGKVQANLDKAHTYLRRAVEAGADVIAFPEMYLTNYMAQKESRELAEPLSGPSVRQLSEWAERYGIWIVMGMPTLEADWPGYIHNSAVVVSPGAGVVGAHHKISLPTFCIDDLLLTEGNFWSPGTQFPLFRIHGWTVGVNICADCWVPEVPRIQAINGAQLLLTISAGPSIFREGWPLVLRTRAIENAAFQVYANVVGTHRGVDFFGGNLAVSPDGTIMAQGPMDEEHLLIVDLPMADLHRSRAQYPRLRSGYDRHPALYADLTRSAHPGHLRSAQHVTEAADQPQLANRPGLIGV